MKRIFGILAVFLICTALFTASGYFYLNNSDTASAADRTLTDVPYSSLPDDTAVLFSTNGQSILLKLDFSLGMLTVITRPDEYSLESEYYTVVADSRAVAGIIDRIGGIELTENGTLMRYTGLQVARLIYSEELDEKKQIEILTATLEKLAAEGLSRQDLVYIIENTDTELTVPDCFYWPDNIKTLFENYTID